MKRARTLSSSSRQRRLSKCNAGHRYDKPTACTGASYPCIIECMDGQSDLSNSARSLAIRELAVDFRIIRPFLPSIPRRSAVTERLD